MWNFIAKLFGGGVSAVVDSAGGLVKTIWGDRAAKDAAIASEQHDVLEQFAAEFVARQQRTWWDSLVDGINRLPRPMMAIGTLGTFVWAAYDPISFTECMVALGVVPEQLWYLWLTIVAFYFGGRILENAPKTWKTEPRALDLAKQIAADRAARRVTEAPQLPGLDSSVPSEAWGESAIHSDEVQATSPIDNSLDSERAVAATIWGEARGESYYGKVAVGWVIRNRVENPGWWGRDWISVCTKKWQFSCWWDSQASRVRFVNENDQRFVECLKAAREVMSDSQSDPTGGATHYYADTIATPKWARDKTPTTKIGHHIFYKIGLS